MVIGFDPESLPTPYELRTRSYESECSAPPSGLAPSTGGSSFLGRGANSRNALIPKRSYSPSTSFVCSCRIGSCILSCLSHVWLRLLSTAAHRSHIACTWPRIVAHRLHTALAHNLAHRLGGNFYTHYGNYISPQLSPISFTIARATSCYLA